MTYLEFLEECQKRTINASIALENENIRQALIEKDDGKVKEVLDNEF